MSQKKVLFADDDRALSQALAFRCKQQLGLDARTSPDGLHAYQCITRDPPDLLVLDVSMPGAGGLYMCEELTRDPRYSTIPVIILTGQSNADTIERCERLGAMYAWKGLDTWDMLKSMIVKALRLEADSPRTPQATPTGKTSICLPQHPLAAIRENGAAKSVLPAPVEAAPSGDESPATVLLIDDDADFRSALSVRFRAAGFRVLTATNGTEGFRTALKQQPDAVVTDFRMPEGCGNNVIGDLREHTLTRNIPIFVVTGQTHSGRPDYSLDRELRALGATGFYTKPPNFDALLREVRERIRTERRVAEAARGAR